MFNKVCGWIINGATAVMMAGVAALTTIAVKDALVTKKEDVKREKEDK